MYVRIKGARRFRVQGAYYPPRMTSGRVKKEKNKTASLAWFDINCGWREKGPEHFEWSPSENGFIQSSSRG